MTFMSLNILAMRKEKIGLDVLGPLGIRIKSITKL